MLSSLSGSPAAMGSECSGASDGATLDIPWWSYMKDQFPLEVDPKNKLHHNITCHQNWKTTTNIYTKDLPKFINETIKYLTLQIFDIDGNLIFFLKQKRI